MTTIELFASKDQESKKTDACETKTKAFNFKAFCKRFGSSIGLFLAACLLFSALLCRGNSNSDRQYFEQLEDVLEEVELSGQINTTQKDCLDQIAIKRVECLATCDFIRSFDQFDDALYERVSDRLGLQDSSAGSLRQAFSLLEKASDLRAKGSDIRFKGALKDLKKTLEHKGFSKTKRSIFLEYLKSIDISL